MIPARGQVWTVKAISGRVRTYVVVHGDHARPLAAGITPVLVCVPLVDLDALGPGILSPRVGEQVGDVQMLCPIRLPAFVEQVGEASPAEMAYLDASLRALLDI